MAEIEDVHLRASRYGGQPSQDVQVTRPANRSRERRERSAKVGGEAGIRTLRMRVSKLVMTRDFWLRRSNSRLNCSRSLSSAVLRIRRASARIPLSFGDILETACGRSPSQKTEKLLNKLEGSPRVYWPFVRTS